MSLTKPLGVTLRSVAFRTRIMRDGWRVEGPQIVCTRSALTGRWTARSEDRDFEVTATNPRDAAEGLAHLLWAVEEVSEA